MKKITKDIAKICIFIALANLPFIHITQAIGINTFIDSFENPTEYSKIYNLSNSSEKIIIIQKTSKNYNIKEGDYILYNTKEGKMSLDKVQKINCMGTLEKYNLTEETNDKKQINQNQVIGKIVNTLDKNFWNDLSLKIWDISINKFNIKSILK